MTRASAEDELRDFARLQVRAGLLSAESQLAEVRDATVAELGLPRTEAEVVARAWLLAARRDLVAEQGRWEEPTGQARLDAALAECRDHDVAVLIGIDDHWAARARLDQGPATLRGVLWCIPMDVWHAIDEPMLELNLWHPTGANVAEGDHLLTAILSCLHRHGLVARFDEGRIEVALRWQRSLP